MPFFLDIHFFICYTEKAGEDTHQKKRSILSRRNLNIKTIAVIDPQGNVYEATYPKRARGLVKKGRARFVNETTICLVRPPYYTEDDMEENRTTAPEGEVRPSDVALTALEGKTGPLDAAYVVAKIDQIMAESANLRLGMQLLGNEDLSGQAALGLASMIEAREKTNQCMIDLLQEIIENL